jgi:signal transduction histidine kinase
VSSTRLLAIAGVLAAGLALAGFGWEFARFGGSSASALQRLETDVRQRVDRQAEQVRALAARVSEDAPLIVDASTSRERLADLFARLATLARDASADGRVSATVYVPGAPAASYRVLAWSEGPSASLGGDRLSGPAALFVAPGSTGVRLVFVQPIERSGRRLAVAVTETILSSADRLDTAMGPVPFLLRYEGAGAGGAGTPPDAFVISSASGAPLLEVDATAADVSARRRAFRAEVLAAAALPLAIAVTLWVVGPLLRRRQRARTAAAWVGWSLCAAAVVMLGAASVATLSTRVGAPATLVSCLVAAAVLAAALLGPALAWWRQRQGQLPRRHPLRFVAEHVAAGVVLAAGITAVERLLASRITADSLDTWQSALFPFHPSTLFEVWTVLLLQVAIAWSAAGLVALVALRWRVGRASPAAAAAALLWLAPTVLMAAGLTPFPRLPLTAALIAAVSAAVFAWRAAAVRRRYRRATQSTRLILGFLALVVPLLAIYPLANGMAERATQDLIAHDFAPAAAGQPEMLRQQVVRAQQEIDRMASLPLLVAGPRPVAPQVASEELDSLSAFEVWRQTGLERSRVTSEVELYGSDRELVSRFALNFPEYRSRALAPWTGRGCDWSVSAESTQFAGVERAMLHAERGICDGRGGLLGAVVILLAPTDYQALPFLPSSNPYADILGGPPDPQQTPQLPTLQLVVYGWSGQPLFVSDPDRAPWSMGHEAFESLYRSGAPFWTRLEAAGRSYEVHVSQNRAGIYALGYPTETLFGHAARLAELAAFAAALFVLLQIPVALGSPVLGARDAPLGRLLVEIRTSFYRKLFLFFVLVATGPVLLFGLAFGAYMNTTFQADVESEARGVIAVAQRVFEAVTSAEQPAGQPASPPTDDIMVWIRQVIDQDVNVYEGPELRATSQRDLFNSALLPTRTPAAVYRTIALNRLPTFVADDRLGRLPYLIAAAPIKTAAGDAMLTVPLAPRQREIARELDELHRGVLVGSVLVILLAAGLGASLASRVSDPVARLTRATRQIAAGRTGVRIAADRADELGRLVDNFNSMTATLAAQQAELARTNQLKAWNEMARQVAHEIKNPLTPVQLAAEHLVRVHEDHRRPLGDVFDQCVRTILGQVRLLRQIASEFANFAGEPTQRPETFSVDDLLRAVIEPYRLGVAERVAFTIEGAADLPPAYADRTLVARAVTNLVENAIQAMPDGGALRVTARAAGAFLVIEIVDTGVGMDRAALEHAFEPSFSTKTAGSGLGLANAKRNIELQGGTVSIASGPGRGTTVTLTLPVAPRPGDGESARAPSR